MLMQTMSFSMQETTQIATRTVPVFSITTNISIPRANNFSMSMFGSMDPVLKQAFDEAFARPNISLSEVKGICPTENCAWQSYDSLAMCAEVFEPVHDLHISCWYKPGCSRCSSYNPVSSSMDNDYYNVKQAVTPIFVAGLEFNSWAPQSYGPGNDSYQDVYLAMNSTGLIRLRLKDKMKCMGEVDVYKVRFSLCSHSYDSSSNWSRTSTNLTYKTGPITNASSWNWTQSKDTKLNGRCGSNGNLSSCFRSSGQHDSTYLLRFILNQLQKGHINSAQMALEDGSYDIHDAIKAGMAKPHNESRVDFLIDNLATSFTNG